MNILRIAVAILFIWAIVSTALAVNYYFLYMQDESLISSIKAKVSTVSVNLLIKFDNGTKKWYNNTVVPLGSSLFNVTKKVANVNYTQYSFGIYVVGINGIMENKQQNKYWFWWYYSGNSWYMGPVAADKYIVSNNETLAWVYSPVNVTSWQPLVKP
ncbi:MAG: DUF4430 domain-containing protein [Thermoprotei archaeon]|jgi:hypothetical protein